jgi:hypothetical protein
MLPHLFISKFRSYIFAIMFVCAFLSCKKQTKYDEDPKRSKLTPKQRLFGEWSISGFTFNGDDITPKLNALFSNRFDVLTLQLGYVFHESEDDDALTITCHNAFTASDQLFDGVNVTFHERHFQYRDTAAADSVFKKWLITPFQFTNQTEQSWRVTKLFENSLHMVLETDTGDFKMFFQKD